MTLERVERYVIEHGAHGIVLRMRQGPTRPGRRALLYREINVAAAWRAGFQ